MIHLRRLSQLLFLILFVYLILATVDPLSRLIPVNFFFITNPLIAITSIIASRTFVFILTSSLVIILVTIFLGRVYCSWVCPLGSTIDIFNRLFLRWKKKQHFYPKWRKIKFLILTVIIIAAIFGVSVVGWVDPISIAFKSYALVIYPVFDWTVKTILDGLGLYQFSSFLTDLGVIDENAISFQYSVLFLGIFIIILFLNLIQARFWCRNLCPLGALLGILSKWRFLRVRIGENCQECNQCINACKMGALQHELVSLDEDCINCFICDKACKFDALSINFKNTSVKDKISVLPSRRAFLTATLLGVISAPLLRGSLSWKSPSPLTRLRPPGAARNETDFLARCIRCGECMKACPTNGLQPLLFQNGLYGMWSPILIPRVGYCTHECNLCGQVCPTGAIAPLGLDEKKKWQIGIARVDKNRCINCLRCEEYCPVPEKAIKIYEEDGLRYPQVVNQLCVGCGTCEHVCSVDPAAIRVFPRI